jgi:hypothetical protein
MLLPGQERTQSEVKDYFRLYERFQRLRPEDPPDETAKLVALVEDGILKEKDGVFVLNASGDDNGPSEIGTNFHHLFLLKMSMGTFFSQHSQDTCSRILGRLFQCSRLGDQRCWWGP